LHHDCCPRLLLVAEVSGIDTAYIVTNFPSVAPVRQSNLLTTIYLNPGITSCHLVYTYIRTYKECLKYCRNRNLSSVLRSAKQQLPRHHVGPGSTFLKMLVWRPRRCSILPGPRHKVVYCTLLSSGQYYSRVFLARCYGLCCTIGLSTINMAKMMSQFTVFVAGPGG
jgi:hypothetical protein